MLVWNGWNGSQGLGLLSHVGVKKLGVKKNKEEESLNTLSSLIPFSIFDLVLRYLWIHKASPDKNAATIIIAKLSEEEKHYYYYYSSRSRHHLICSYNQTLPSCDVLNKIMLVLLVVVLVQQQEEELKKRNTDLPTTLICDIFRSTKHLTTLLLSLESWLITSTSIKEVITNRYNPTLLPCDVSKIY